MRHGRPLMTAMNGRDWCGDGPLVSVVVIFLNEERYLGEAVASVLAQTHQSWELLLVDDGSTDGSSALARGLAACKPEQVRYLEHAGHANLGMSASRNAGLRAARGRYVAFLDADDVLRPATLADQVALLEAHPRVAMAYGPAEWWHSWSGTPAPSAADRLQPLGVEPNQLAGGLEVLASFLLREGTHPTGALFRRSALMSVGGYEEQFRGMYEDQVVRVKLCVRFPAYVSDRSWYRYRQRQDSCCAVAVRLGEHLRSRERFLVWVGRYLREQHVMDRAVWRAQRQALWRCRYLRALTAARAAGVAATDFGRGVLPMVRSWVTPTSVVGGDRP